MRNTVHRWMRVAATVATVAALGSTAAANETPEPATQNGIAYVTGGVGQDEVDALRAAASKYNLRMMFASRSGEYLSDVDVTIRAAAAQPVLTVRTRARSCMRGCRPASTGSTPATAAPSSGEACACPRAAACMSSSAGPSRTGAARCSSAIRARAPSTLTASGALAATSAASSAAPSIAPRGRPGARAARPA